jgi:hypothetical protein
VIEFEAVREQDRIYAFCLSGLGHQNVTVEAADPSVGIFGSTAYCEDCGMDLSDFGLLNGEGF